MKELNKIKLTRTATILQCINSGGHTYNGNKDIFMGSVKAMHELAENILGVINDELKEDNKLKEDK